MPTKELPLQRKSRTSQDILSLELDMTAYLQRNRREILASIPHVGPEKAESIFTQRGSHLLRAAKSFDSSVEYGIGDTKLVMTHGADEIVGQLNEETAATPQNQNFTDRVNCYIQDLSLELEDLVTRVQMGRTAYLMEGGQKYREEAAERLEGVLRKLKEAKDLSDNELGAGSEDYRKVDSSYPERRSSAPPGITKKKDLGDAERHRIVSEMNALVESFGVAKDTEKIRDRLLALTSDILHHLHDNLGEPGLKVIGEKGVRPLDHLVDGALHQLEAMLSILNAIVRDYENIVTVHRDMLSGTIRAGNGAISS